MKELNIQWRGEKRAPDVLAFPQGNENARCGDKKDGPPQILGDLAIRADKSSITDRQLVHGVLHLLGHEHNTDRKLELMRKKEDEVLRGLACA